MTRGSVESRLWDGDFETTGMAAWMSDYTALLFDGDDGKVRGMVDNKFKWVYKICEEGQS